MSDADRRAVRRGVILLGIGETLIWACIYYVFAALLLAWETDLGWEKADLTLGLTVAILAAAGASPIAGKLIDAGHGRRVLGFGALFGSTALAALGFVESPVQFVIVWALIGAAQGFSLYEPCFSVVTRALGEKARPAIVNITLMAGFASTVSFLSAAALADAYGWRLALFAMAGAGAFVAAPMLFVGAAILERAGGVSSVPAAPAATNKAALAAALKKPQFWLIAIAFPIMAIDHGMLLNHIMPLLAEREIPRDTAILVASTIGPMQVLGRVVMMLLQRWISTIGMAAISFGGVFAAALVLMSAGASPTLAFLFAAMQGGSYGLTSIIKPAMTAEFLGRTGFGTIAGWLATPYLLGSAAAPHLAALLWAAGGYALVIPVAAALSALGVACILGLAALGRARPVGKT